MHQDNDDESAKRIVDQCLQDLHHEKLTALYEFMAIWNTSNSINEAAKRMHQTAEWALDMAIYCIGRHPILLKALDNEDWPEDEISPKRAKELRKKADAALQPGSKYLGIEKALCMKVWEGRKTA